jgi:hypothetical protein
MHYPNRYRYARKPGLRANGTTPNCSIPIELREKCVRHKENGPPQVTDDQRFSRNLVKARKYRVILHVARIALCSPNSAKFHQRFGEVLPVALLLPVGLNLAQEGRQDANSLSAVAPALVASDL